MHQVKAVLVRASLACALLGVLYGLGGCSGGETAVQPEASKDITKAKMEEMQKGMMGTLQEKGQKK